MKRTDITALFPEATDEQINQIMSINGADINAAKTGLTDLQEQLTAANANVAELMKRPTADALSALQTELDGLKAANALRDMRDAVAKDKGVPADLLTAETKDACEAQAQRLIDFAKASGYPAIRDGGDPANPPNAQKTREKFAAWATENF